MCGGKEPHGRDTQHGKISQKEKNVRRGNQFNGGEKARENGKEDLNNQKEKSNETIDEQMTEEKSNEMMIDQENDQQIETKEKRMLSGRVITGKDTREPIKIEKEQKLMRSGRPSHGKATHLKDGGMIITLGTSRDVGVGS